MLLFTLRHFMLLDGFLFVLIGIIVLINPSPQTTLKIPVNEVALPPFQDTRRLLASQFITSGLLIESATTSARRIPVRSSSMISA